MRKSASEAGFTLLELALSLALGTVLVTSFFFSYRGMMQAISFAANDASGATRVAELLGTITQELDRADNVEPTITNGELTFKLGGQDITYRLAVVASADAYVERRVGLAPAPFVPLGPRRVIANANPHGATLKAYDNADVTGGAPVPFFVVMPSTGTQSTQVVLHAVVQANREMPPRYVRARSALRLRP